jgi:hypothetical protein
VSYGTRMPPRHFWPGAALEAGARFPCGLPAGTGPFLVTADPVAVTCRRCIASHLVQGLLDTGATQVRLERDELVRLGLLPGGAR